MDLNTLIQAILFALFAILNAVLAAVIGPTYDHLLVPELAPSALYPPFPAPVGAAPSFLSNAAGFSAYLVVNLVDPAIAILVVGVALLYLARPFLGRHGPAPEPLFARLLFAIVLSNFSLPILGAILTLAGASYPVVADYDGGAWMHWVNLEGTGGFVLSVQNGALTFVLSLVLFTLVLSLVLLVGLRDALLAVLVVTIPLFTLLWPIPPLSGLAKRAWMLFAEMAFLPCLLVIPLELAVGAPNVVILVGFLSVAVASPYLLSVGGSHLSALGFPGGAGMVGGGVQRGLAGAGGAGSSYFTGAIEGARGGSALAGAARAGVAAGRAVPPLTAPLLVGDFLGRGSAHLVQHLRKAPQPRPGSGAPLPKGG